MKKKIQNIFKKATPATTKDTRLGWIFLSTALVALLLVLFAHAFLPGQVGNARARVMVYGAFDCGEYATSEMLRQKCDLLGGDAGGLYPTGYPFMITGSLIKKAIPIMSSEVVYVLLATAIVVTSMFFGYRLGRLVGLRKWSALAVITLYLASPIVISMSSFGGTLWGALLLPVWIYIPLQFIDKVIKKKSFSKVEWLSVGIVFLIINTVALFVDGYTYFMAQAAVAIVGAISLFFNYMNKNLYILGVYFAISNVVAYLIYSFATPIADTLGSSPIDFFRAMGADLISFIVPSSGTMLASVVGTMKAASLWGDGTNNSSNYMGITLLSVLFLSFILAAIAWRRGKLRFDKKNSRHVVLLSFILTAAISFALSLGPSLKVNQQKNFEDTPVTMKSYLMDRNAAGNVLPTEYIYTHIPGLKSMRAIYRWHLLTYLMVLIVVFTFVEKISRKNGVLAAAIVFVIFLEAMPDLKGTYIGSIQNAQKIDEFTNSVVEPMKQYVDQDDRLLFYPNNGNDFLVNYIAPSMRAFTFNVGNDKSRHYAEALWPFDIKLVLGTKNTSDYKSLKVPIANMLKVGTVDAVIVPKFDTRTGLDATPVNLLGNDEKARMFVNAVKSREISINEEEFFYIIERVTVEKAK